MQVYSLIYAEFILIFKEMLYHKFLTNLLNCLTPYKKTINKNITSYYIKTTLLPKVIGKLTLSEYVT